MSVISDRAPLDAVSISLVRRAASEGTARRVRELSGLSLDEMARFVHVSPQTILRWELNRRRPRAEAAQRYAEALRLLIATLSDSDLDNAIASLQHSLESVARPS